MTTGRDQPVEGRFDGSTHRFPVRVYFEDTDLSGVVYHANYLRFMERARSDMLRLAGVDQRAAHEAGEGAYAVASLAIRYAAPARLDDALVVETKVTEVMRGDILLAEADVVAALVAPSGRPRRQPGAWIDRFNSLLAKRDQTP